MEDKFTLEEIRNYIKSQDSLGDVMYNLNATNIMKANEPEKSVDDCAYYDEHQGKNFCTLGRNGGHCMGICKYFEDK